MSEDRFKVWSEYRKGSAVDSLSGLDAVGEDDVIDHMIVRDGVIVKPNCNNCGRQMQQLHVWPELVHAYRGLPPPQGLRYSLKGPIFDLQCQGCAKFTPELIEIDELRRWLEAGVRARWVPPQVLQLARR